jgi:hypothetical protein|tara:strand:- start:103805 stop:104644 length:840 start_codon:yes stop_codon:yes gene_type:complete
MKSRFFVSALIGTSFFGAAAIKAAESGPMPNPRLDDVTSLSGFSASTGVAYWQGDFGLPTRSNLLVVPLSLKYDFGDLRVWGTLPYMRVESDALLFAGTDGGPIEAGAAISPGQARVRDGLADLTLGGTWSLTRSAEDGFDVDVTTRVKLPTASNDSGLSTGKTDVTLAADIAKPIGGIVPYVSAGYRFLGDPDGFDLNNTLHLAGGFSVPLGERGDTVALLAYEYDESPSRLVDDGHELFSAVSGSINDRFSWTGYGSVGLNEGASDFALGLLLTAAF